jgi:o-succinylbenzoate synthase
VTTTITRHVVDLPLRQAARVGTRTLVARRCHLVRLEDDGVTGWGEATPVPGWPRPPVGSALAMAHRDRDARRAGVPLASTLTDRPATAVPVNALVGDDEPDVVAAQVELAVAAGYQAVKLKVAGGPPERDLARIRAAAEVVAGRAALRLDANGRWDLDTALTVLTRLDGTDVEYVEEPVAGAEDFRRVRSGTPFPVAIDEQATTPDAARRAIDEAWADVIVLKPTLLGDLAVAVALGRRAHAAGIVPVVTTVVDSAVGVTAALHVAAALPGPIRPCGLATSGLLRRDVADVPPVVDGMMSVPVGPGLGIDVRLPAPVR